jgi:hypothetical protein
MGHPCGFGHPLEFVAQAERSPGRGCDPRSLVGAHVPSPERLVRPRPTPTVELCPQVIRPLQRYWSILTRTPAVELHPQVLSRCGLH